MSTTERQRLEQEALQQLNRGSTDGALKAYIQILKLAPTDRRVRQKVGEIYLRQGRAAEAEKHLREVAESLIRDGSHRAAVAVLKQLVGLRGDAPELHLDLGDCYLAAGYSADAKASFETAAKTWLAMGKPLDAATASRRLAELAPGELALRLRTAELLEAGNDNDQAAAVYAEVIEEYRRRGRTDEVGRVAELALRLKPDDVGLLLDAAGARVASGEYKKALVALQAAFVAAPKEARTLDLLARAFEGAGQADRAMKVLLELSRVLLDRGDHAGEVDALRRAAALAPDDEDVATRLQVSLDRLGRFERKLGSLQLAQPSVESELRAIVRVEVFSRYGMHDLAEGEARAALALATDSLPLLAALAEVMIAAGKKADAIAAMERLVPRAGSEASEVLERLGMVRGVVEMGAFVEDEPAQEPASDDSDIDPDAFDVRDLPAPPAGGPSADFHPEPSTIAQSTASLAASDAPFDSSDDEGDALLRGGDMQGALMAWRRVLADDPLNEPVLAKIASLRTALRSGTPPTSAPPAPVGRQPQSVAPSSGLSKPVAAASPPAVPLRQPAPVPAPSESLFRTQRAAVAPSAPVPVAAIPDGTFAEIEPEIVDDEPSVDGLADARTLLAQGQAAAALTVARSLSGLAARVVEAQAHRVMGDLASSLEVLREATNAAPEDDPAYPEALFDLAVLYSATAKHRSALRLLEELADLAPLFRSDEVEAKIRGLQSLAR